MARNTPTPHLDALAELGAKPVIRHQRIRVALVVGEDADAIGAAGLQELANVYEMPVIVEQPSQYHAAKLFRPKAAVVNKP